MTFDVEGELGARASCRINDGKLSLTRPGSSGPQSKVVSPVRPKSLTTFARSHSFSNNHTGKKKRPCCYIHTMARAQATPCKLQSLFETNQDVAASCTGYYFHTRMSISGDLIE